MCGIIICTFSQNILAQNTIQIHKDAWAYPLGHLVEILEDKTQKLIFEEVIKQENAKNFKRSTQKHPNQGYSPHNYWFRIRIAQSISEHNILPEKWYLVFQNSNIDTLQVFFIDEKKQIIQTYLSGDCFPFSSRPVLYPKFIFPIPTEKNIEVYIKLSGYYAKRHDLEVIHEKKILENAQYYFGEILFTMAMVMGLVVYNLLLYLSVRDKAYLFYVLYLFGVSAYILGINGLAFQYIFPHYPQLTGIFNNLFVVLGAISGQYFTYYFLKMDTWLPRIYLVAFNILVLIGGGICAILVFSVYFMPKIFGAMLSITALYMLVSTLFTLFFGVYGGIKKIRPAYFFLLAWIFLIFSTFFYLFQLFGLQISANFSDMMVRLGVLSEAFILSFGLSDKIKTTEKEKQQAQAENLKLVTEQKATLEEKVTERTQELKESNEELHQTNEELGITLEMVNNQKTEIELINKNIKDSINYAQRIQSSMLPTYQEINSHLEENFILFKPKDIISGDFYYFQEINNKIIISAIDCTGHGVPGALMTMVANESLNEIILNKGILQPDIILNELHKNIRKTLKQAETNNKDGMDMVLLVIDKQQKIAEFAGAKNPLLYIQNNEIHQIKGDKMPIGGEQKEQERIFTKHSIDISQKTTFYLFSDGYVDQFGGTEKRKFMISNFRKLLLEIHTKNMLAQKQTLEKTFANWITDGEEKQIDDVLVMGVKL